MGRITGAEVRASRFVSSSGLAPLPTDPASYLGVYEAEAIYTYQPIADFAQMADKQPNLVGYYSGCEEPFQTSFAGRFAATARPRSAQWHLTRASVAEIATVDYDAYLRSFADSVRDFGHSVVIGFGYAMNAYWYSWATSTSRPRRSWQRGDTS
jgi:hypothetical protein